MFGSTATRTEDFTNSIGINTHIGDTKYPTLSNLNSVEADLGYLGIKNIRDAGGSTIISQFEALAAQGIKIDFTDYYYSTSMSTFISQAAQVDMAYPGAIAFIEGPNEADGSGGYSYNGLSGAAAADQNQKDLYAAVQANSTLTGMPIIVWPLSFESNASLQGNMTGYANFGNLHDYYSGNFSTPILLQLQAAIATEQSIVLPGAPIMVTETGYSTATLDPSGYGVDNATQAKLTIDTVLDGAKVGLKMDYLYDLIDDNADASNGVFNQNGLFDGNNQPKPAATALKNLVSVLSDTGSNATTFTADGLNYVLAGMPSTANFYLFEKSNGTFDLALWNEPDIWNPSTHQQIATPTNPITVNLGQTFGTVAVYDPITGSTPIATYNNVSQIQVGLSADALIVEASGTSTAPPVTAPDMLTLRISEDAWQDDAKFMVKVDGTQIGGTLTAFALHVTGDSNVFALTGAWGAGTHDVQIQFVNDAYGGTPATDRNLYVNSVAYNGTTYSGTTATMLSNGTCDFSVGGGATAATAPADTLTLHLSEDAWNGNSQFELTIDGKQVSTPQGVATLHNSGSWQDFTFAGNFGAGTHTVGVQFTNDAYGGSPATDRNLYVNGVDCNGKHYGSGVTLLLSNGTATFTITTTH